MAKYENSCVIAYLIPKQKWANSTFEECTAILVTKHISSPAGSWFEPIASRATPPFQQYLDSGQLLLRLSRRPTCKYEHNADLAPESSQDNMQQMPGGRPFH